MQHLSDFSKRLETLETIVSKLASRVVESAGHANPPAEGQGSVSEERESVKDECKLKVKGRQSPQIPQVDDKRCVWAGGCTREMWR